MSDTPRPSYGEVWQIDFDPVRGHEQGGTRPGLVLSNDTYNHSAAQMVIVAPITSRFRPIPMRVQVDPPEGGLHARSFIKCEDLRAVSTTRLVRRLGMISQTTMAEVADRLRILLNL
jgi:mRNA interferase MazF